MTDNVENKIFEEERVALIPIGVHLKCNVCGEGYLEVVDPNGTQVSNTLATYPIPPVTYEHRCTMDTCTNVAFFDDVFPRIEYDNMENYVESEG